MCYLIWHMVNYYREHYHTKHRERGNKVIKNDEHYSTFLTSLTSHVPVFSPPLHMPVVCVCVQPITDCSIAAFLIVRSCQLEADWEKMNSTGGRNEGKLGERWLGEEGREKDGYNFNKSKARSKGKTVTFSEKGKLIGQSLKNPHLSFHVAAVSLIKVRQLSELFAQSDSE